MSSYHLMRASQLVIATHNTNKFKEFSNLIKPFGIVTISSGELKLPEPEETANTFAGNATIKAQKAAYITNLPDGQDQIKILPQPWNVLTIT